MSVGDAYATISPDIDKGVMTRLMWWVRTACANKGWLRPWDCVFVFLSLLRILPARYRGRAIAVSPPGTDLTLKIRVGTSDLKVYEDIFLAREYEWPLRSPPSVIVDAGAYTGLSAAWFASAYPTAAIIAIEPSGSNFELLARNTEDFPNVQLRRAALWHEKCSLVMVDPGHGAFAFRVRIPADTSDEGEEDRSELVDAITVSDVVAEFSLERIDLLKVDIEGSEIEVFSGASEWIDRVEAVCLDLHDRLRPGCSRVFFSAMGDFPVEVRRGESLLVARDERRLTTSS